MAVNKVDVVALNTIFALRLSKTRRTVGRTDSRLDGWSVTNDRSGKSDWSNPGHTSTNSDAQGRAVEAVVVAVAMAAVVAAVLAAVAVVTAAARPNSSARRRRRRLHRHGRHHCHTTAATATATTTGVYVCRGVSGFVFASITFVFQVFDFKPAPVLKVRSSS